MINVYAKGQDRPELGQVGRRYDGGRNARPSGGGEVGKGSVRKVGFPGCAKTEGVVKRATAPTRGEARGTRTLLRGVNRYVSPHKLDEAVSTKLRCVAQRFRCPGIQIDRSMANGPQLYMHQQNETIIILGRVNRMPL